MGSWLGKLFPIIKSMVNFQPQQAIEPGRKAPETNSKEGNPEESHDYDVSKEQASLGSSSRSSNGASNGKRKHVTTIASRKENIKAKQSLNWNERENE